MLLNIPSKSIPDNLDLYKFQPLQFQFFFLHYTGFVSILLIIFLNLIFLFAPSNGILPMLRIPNRQNLLPEYRTEFFLTVEQLLTSFSPCLTVPYANPFLP